MSAKKPIPTDGAAFARFVGIPPRPGSVAAKAAARLAGVDGEQFARRVGVKPPRPRPRPGAGEKFLESIRGKK